jgi:heparanase
VLMTVINTDRAAPRQLMLANASLRYTLDAADLSDADIRLNGTTLALDPRGGLPDIEGTPMAAGIATFDPATISFLAVPAAANSACRDRT